MTRFCPVVLLLLSFSIDAAAQEFISERKPPSGRTFGVGLGIPYGVIGVNVDFKVDDFVNLSAGIGSTVFAGLGYSIGMKYFITSPESAVRPRLSAYYGTNYVFVREYYGIDRDDEGETYNGLTLGIGLLFMMGNSRSNGFDIDIMYITTTSFDAVEKRSEGFVFDESKDVKFSVGYRHAL
ncbi:MAG: hypothetical protein ABIK83_15810 [Candidatus Zixiibacteriota bacterium]